MSELNSLHQPDLGYYFYPAEVVNHPGHPRMDVILCSEPSGQHYDPIKAQYPVTSTERGIDKLTVCHPWRQSDHYRASCGRIMLTDRVGKTVEAFTFGGDLEIDTRIDRTVCALASPAPIFSLHSSWDLPMWLTAEVELLLACLKAHYHPQHRTDFEEQLSATDPFILYTCCLEAILERSCDSQMRASDLDHRREHFLREEIRRIKDADCWPYGLCTLNQLFLGEEPHS